MKPRPVLVEWDDAAGGSGWEPTARTARRKTLRVRTAGWLLKRTRKRLVIGLSLCENGEGDGCMVIPAACVRRVRRLR